MGAQSNPLLLKVTILEKLLMSQLVKFDSKDIVQKQFIQILLPKYQALVTELVKFEYNPVDVNSSDYYILRRINNPFETRFKNNQNAVSLSNCQQIQEFKFYRSLAIENAQIFCSLAVIWGPELKEFVLPGLDVTTLGKYPIFITSKSDFLETQVSKKWTQFEENLLKIKEMSLPDASLITQTFNLIENIELWSAIFTRAKSNINTAFRKLIKINPEAQVNKNIYTFLKEQNKVVVVKYKEFEGIFAELIAGGFNLESYTILESISGAFEAEKVEKYKIKYSESYVNMLKSIEAKINVYAKKIK